MLGNTLFFAGLPSHNLAGFPGANCLKLTYWTTRAYGAPVSPFIISWSVAVPDGASAGISMFTCCMPTSAGDKPAHRTGAGTPSIRNNRTRTGEVARKDLRAGVVEITGENRKETFLPKPRCGSATGLFSRREPCLSLSLPTDVPVLVPVFTGPYCVASAAILKIILLICILQDGLGSERHIRASAQPAGQPDPEPAGGDRPDKRQSSRCPRDGGDWPTGLVELYDLRAFSSQGPSGQLLSEISKLLVHTTGAGQSNRHSH